ncbi:MAG: ZIP family metal transporter [Candidatus ainarchaeum sp.]|nr:ZIP family metal transporter [Candidatus ainarchaeum sp.]
MLFELFFSILIISLISLIGVLTLAINKKKLDKRLDLLVSLSVGALLGSVFLHLLPELAHDGLLEELFIFVLIGMILFFILEKFVFWHHCHKAEHKHLSFTYMNLIGDALHNMLDGALLAGTFMISVQLGFVTAIAIALHEIPQEIGDFGVLLKGGFSRKQALIANFAIALTAFLGAILTIIFSNLIQGLTPIIVAITAGGFIYIAATDLIPELHKNPNIKNSISQLIFILIGIGLMMGVTLLHLH